MKIGRTPNGIITLEPEDGMAITDGNTVSDSIVFLGKNDSPERWYDCEKPDEPQDEEATLEDVLEKLRELGVDV